MIERCRMGGRDPRPVRSRRAAALAAGASAVLWVLALVPGAARAGEALEYNRDVRPILSENCFLCHGPDASARKAGLRLDTRTEALKPARSGEPAIVPGKPAESELIRRITAHDESEGMPPPKAKKSLCG